jgi:hypothetical protein
MAGKKKLAASLTEALTSASITESVDGVQPALKLVWSTQNRRRLIQQFPQYRQVRGDHGSARGKVLKNLQRGHHGACFCSPVDEHLALVWREQRVEPVQPGWHLGMRDMTMKSDVCGYRSGIFLRRCSDEMQLDVWAASGDRHQQFSSAAGIQAPHVAKAEAR